MIWNTMVKKIVIWTLISLVAVKMVHAQEGRAFYEGDMIHGVFYVFSNPLADSFGQRNIQAKLEQKFPVYPRTPLRTILLDAYTARLKQLAEVESAHYELRSAPTGGVEVILQVTLSSKAKQPDVVSVALVGKKDFPLLYLDDRSLLTTKISISEMLYSNGNSWYGRDDKMVQGNPLADHPAGQGYTGWVEGWASAGLYGITTVSARRNMFLYGGASYIVSGSAGREIFTDRPRFHGGMDDAFAGFLGTSTLHNGHRLTYNLTGGRQQFSIGKGFIIRNTSANGDERAALQLNPRWAADFLGLLSIKYDNLLVQAFHLDPDELPVVDSRTKIVGVNLEWGDKSADQIGFTLLNVPSSSSKYYTPDGKVYGRQGLWLYNLRLFGSRPAGVPGLFYRAEIAYEKNGRFDMGAYAGYGEIGWDFAKSKGTPVLAYRFAYFSGDDPATQKYERWDPLLTGGSGEEWVTGANHFKVVQNSNMIVNRLQLNWRPTKRLELVPQLLYLVAAQHNNIGGNPALSYLPKKAYGQEVNLSWKYYMSRRWYFHGHFALTVPGAGVTSNLEDARPWFSAMVFFRYSIF